MTRPVTNIGILRQIAQTVVPSMFLDYCLFLEKIYEAAGKQIKDYNYKKFSADLGFGESTLMNQIVRGFRPLTAKSADLICKKLYIRNTERRFLMNLVRYKAAHHVGQKEKFFKALVEAKSETLPSLLEKAIMEYLTEWFNPVVREICAAGLVAPNHHDKLAKMLEPSIRPEQARKCLELLQNIGLIEFDEMLGRYKTTSQHITTGHRVRGVGIARYHQQLIALGSECLTRFGAGERDVSGLTIRATQEEFERIREIFRLAMADVQKEIERAGRKTEGERVYQVNVQVFPLSDVLKIKETRSQQKRSDTPTDKPED